MAVQFVGKRDAERLTGLSHETLKKYRFDGKLTEGIHFVRQNQRLVLYNAALLADWIQNRADPQAHQRAIDNYLISLPSNQPVRRRRAA